MDAYFSLAAAAAALGVERFHSFFRRVSMAIGSSAVCALRINVNYIIIVIAYIRFIKLIKGIPAWRIVAGGVQRTRDSRERESYL